MLYSIFKLLSKEEKLQLLLLFYFIKILALNQL